MSHGDEFVPVSHSTYPASRQFETAQEAEMDSAVGSDRPRLAPAVAIRAIPIYRERGPLHRNSLLEKKPVACSRLNLVPCKNWLHNLL
jgi:hypothetical protein